MLGATIGSFPDALGPHSTTGTKPPASGSYAGWQVVSCEGIAGKIDVTCAARATSRRPMSPLLLGIAQSQLRIGLGMLQYLDTS